ncbi:unnamed protein product [Lactuca saligna]|uniref:Uncharacterized protein n=1 Tax=Lactuca saligna TaxID=75948 RepID=A0AA35VFW0_LACSI|nr:unnamed protein product [Lactuca saligna]
MVGLRVPPADAAGQNVVEGLGIGHAETLTAASKAGQNGPQLRASRRPLRHLLPLVPLRRHLHHHRILEIHLLGLTDMEEAKYPGRLCRMKNRSNLVGCKPGLCQSLTNCTCGFPDGATSPSE